MKEVYQFETFYATSRAYAGFCTHSNRQEVNVGRQQKRNCRKRKQIKRHVITQGIINASRKSGQLTMRAGYCFLLISIPGRRERNWILMIASNLCTCTAKGTSDCRIPSAFLYGPLCALFLRPIRLLLAQRACQPASLCIGKWKASW